MGSQQNSIQHLYVLNFQHKSNKSQVQVRESAFPKKQKKMKVKLHTNHLSQTPQKWELRALGTTFKYLILPQ